MLGRFVCVQNVLLPILENTGYYIALHLEYFCCKAPEWFVLVGLSEDNKWKLIKNGIFPPPFSYSIK